MGNLCQNEINIRKKIKTKSKKKNSENNNNKLGNTNSNQNTYNIPNQTKENTDRNNNDKTLINPNDNKNVINSVEENNKNEENKRTIVKFGENNEPSIKKGKIKMTNKKEEKNKKEPENNATLLKIKMGETPKYGIKKNHKTSFLNSIYDLILKVTLTKIMDNDLYLVELKDEKSGKILDKSEQRKANQNNLLTFSKNFIVKYDFTKIQPLSFTIKKTNKSFTPIKKNLGDIVGKPRQIYFEETTDFNFEVEAIMHSEINKEVQFIIGLEGNLKNLKINYSIKSLGNRYDEKKEKLVYKSKILENDTEVIFEQVDFPLNQLSADDNLDDNLILISFFDGENELGIKELSISQLFEKDIEEELNNNIKAKITSQRKNFFTFLQYLYNDYHLITNFCIDFNKKNSVHENQTNFENLILKFLDILVPYKGDTFFRFYAYGFKLKKDQTKYINEIGFISRKRPSLQIEEVKKKYESFFGKIEQLKENCDLSLIIKNINDSVNENYDLSDKEYNLFLLFACNDVIDEEEFIKQIMITSTLNISLVIIPIGNKPLTKLEIILKNIDYIKDKDGNAPKREFIKYVEMESDHDKIIQNALVNIPDEMIDFFCLNNAIPK